MFLLDKIYKIDSDSDAPDEKSKLFIIKDKIFEIPTIQVGDKSASDEQIDSLF